MAQLIHPGRFYKRMARADIGRPIRDLVWICRRLEDYGQAGPGVVLGQIGWCNHCGRPVLFDPESPVPADTPKWCLQCAGIEPLPFEPADRPLPFGDADGSGH
jgi:hypothetical protein